MTDDTLRLANQSLSPAVTPMSGQPAPDPREAVLAEALAEHALVGWSCFCRDWTFLADAHREPPRTVRRRTHREEVMTRLSEAERKGLDAAVYSLVTRRLDAENELHALVEGIIATPMMEALAVMFETTAAGAAMWMTSGERIGELVAEWVREAISEEASS